MDTTPITLLRDPRKSRRNQTGINGLWGLISPSWPYRPSRLCRVMARNYGFLLLALLITVAGTLMFFSSRNVQSTSVRNTQHIISPIVKVDVDCPIKATLNGSLLTLISLLDNWAQSPTQACRQTEQLFRRLFDFRPRRSSIGLSPLMKSHLSQWFGGRQDLLALTLNQTLIHIRNKWTYSATIFNLLRAMRPKKANSNLGMDDRQYVGTLLKQQTSCDFCNLNYTATDTFGRIYGNHSYTAANVFKLEEWHSLVIFKTHHPIDWGYTEFYDSFMTANKWFHKVNTLSPPNIYPHIFWDLLGRAGGSQPHPHHHPFLSRYGYYGYYKKWQDVAEQYMSTHGRNYFSDLIQTHFDIGLAVRWGNAVAFAAINPKKDYEIVVIASELCKDYLDLIYFVTRAYFEDLGYFSLSAGFVLPPLDKKVAGLPAIARLISRGSVTSKHSDTTSMELFATSLVETDPYKAFRLLEASIKKRKALVKLKS